MNQLSWLIYFAGVSDSISSVLNTIFVLSIIISALGVLGCAIVSAASDENHFPLLKPFLLPVIGAFLVSGILTSFVPSKETVYAIAASEYGERALQSPTATKAIKALNAWLDKQAAK